MHRLRLISLACGALAVALLASPTIAWGQLPFNRPTREADRLPNDSIEGMIWEYEGKLKGTPADDEKDLALEGKFRVEGSAIFAVSPTIELPDLNKVKRTVDKVVKGGKVELSLPEGPQQNRLGEFKKISGGKYRLDFKDKETLNGIMIIWKKKDSDSVWIGTFAEREGTKTVRNWDVELRAIED